MQARSALFDLYGDYLRPRGGRAAVAALVRLLAPLDIAAPAVRTAVSRMVRQGWLRPARVPTGPGYVLTHKAVLRLDEAAARIYRTGRSGWNGFFDVIVVIEPPPSRASRGRLAAELAFRGYGTLNATTWVSPRVGSGVDALLRETGVRYERLHASHAAGRDGASELVREAWDLRDLGGAYDRFVERLAPVVAGIAGGSRDEDAYAARFTLVHAWRSFLFRDPQLPPELLPEPWPGTAAAAFFDLHAGRLRPAADRHVDRCLEATARSPVTV